MKKKIVAIIMIVAAIALFFLYFYLIDGVLSLELWWHIPAALIVNAFYCVLGVIGGIKLISSK